MPMINTPLPPALNADTFSLDSSASGRVNVYYDASAEGRPLILLHSINAAPSAIEMRPLFEHFRTRRPVYALEFPGFGHSERPDIRYDKAVFCGAIVQLLDALEQNQVDIIALSLSAEFAARVALEHPARIRSLVLISPTGMGRRALPVRVGRTILGASRVPLVGRGLYRALTTETSIRHFLGMAFVGEPPTDMIRHAIATTRQPGARYAPFHFLSFALFDECAVDNLYLPLRTPALILYDRDPNVSFERMDELMEQGHAWSAARLEPSCGLPHWELPTATFDAIAHFYRTLPV